MLIIIGLLILITIVCFVRYGLDRDTRLLWTVYTTVMIVAVGMFTWIIIDVVRKMNT